MSKIRLTTSINDAIYEDPEVVAGYIKRNAQYSKQKENIDAFSKYISGKQVLDLGCGPGQDSYYLSELGYKVTGLDYSSEMIKQARNLKDVPNKPKFIQGDMRLLQEYFSEKSFDAIWASASLLHIKIEDLALVFQGMRYVLNDNGAIAISLKSGKGTKIVATKKYGKEIKREFIFWDKNNFESLVQQYGFKVVKYFTQQSGANQNTTEWLFFFLKPI